jgi:molybdopterin converting factor small subunit
VSGGAFEPGSVRSQENLVVYQGLLVKDAKTGVGATSGRAWVRLDVVNRHYGERGTQYEGRVFEEVVGVMCGGEYLVGMAGKLKKGDEVVVIGALGMIRPRRGVGTVKGGLGMSHSVVVKAKAVVVKTTFEGRAIRSMVKRLKAGGDGGGGEAVPNPTEVVGRRVVGDGGEETEG